jgi:hypothetical protein
MLGNTKQVQDTNQTTTSAPWAAAQPQLQGLLGQTQGQLQLGSNATDTQNAALGGLASNAAAGNPYAGGIGLLANNLLSGGGTPDRSGIAQGAYGTLQNNIGGIAAGNYVKPGDSINQWNYDASQNPAFQQYLTSLTNDTSDRVKSAYAGAGYSPAQSGDFAKQLGEGIARGTAPAFAQEYDAARNAQLAQNAQNNAQLNAQLNTQLGAASSLYGGGNATAGLLSGLDQTSLANRQAGVGVAGQAWTRITSLICNSFRSRPSGAASRFRTSPDLRTLSFRWRSSAAPAMRWARPRRKR